MDKTTTAPRPTYHATVQLPATFDEAVLAASMEAPPIPFDNGGRSAFLAGLLAAWLQAAGHADVAQAVAELNGGFRIVEDPTPSPPPGVGAQYRGETEIHIMFGETRCINCRSPVGTVAYGFGPSRPQPDVRRKDVGPFCERCYNIVGYHASTLQHETDDEDAGLRQDLRDAVYAQIVALSVLYGQEVQFAAVKRAATHAADVMYPLEDGGD